MKKIICLLLISINSLALTPHKLTYELSVSGFNVATEYRKLTIKNNIYTYTARAKTEGLAAFIKKYSINVNSNFILNNNRFKTIKFSLLEIDEKKIKKNIQLEINNSNINKSYRKIWLNNNVIDILNIFLAIGHDLKYNYPLNYQMLDESEIKKYQFKIIAKEQIFVLNKNINVIKVSDNNKITAYFAPEFDYIPILIKNENWQYILTTYEQ